MKKRIKLLREALDLTQKGMGEILEIPPTAISKYECTPLKPSADILSRFGYKLNVNLHWLLTGEGEMFLEKENVSKEGILRDIKNFAGKIIRLSDSMIKDFPEDKIIPFKRKYPLIEGKAACGTPSVISEEEIIDYIYLLDFYNVTADFAIKTKGQSMIEYGILPDMLIFIKKQSSCESGNIVALNVYEGEESRIIVKKARRLPGGEMAFLDGKGEEMEIQGRVEVIGIVVFWMRDYRES